MGFGDSVSALLDTYNNCLSLLKAFSRKNSQDASRRASEGDDQQALLRHSLKTDRKKVKRAYSSRVSQAGSRFEKGDSKARSALDKVLKKLNAAITGLIRMASRGAESAVDYQSLMSLSNSSRLHAIKAFDRLSHRLDSSSSRGSVASTSTSKSSRSSGSSRSSKTSKTSQSSSSKTSSTASRSTGKSSSNRSKAKLAKKHNKPPTQTPAKPSTRKQSEADSSVLPPPPPLRPGRIETSIPTPLLDAMDRRRNNDQASAVARRSSPLVNRFSLISISSGSTRLGEIPERKWRRGGDDDGEDWDGRSDEYNAPVVYPLRPYQPVVKERRFLGLFRRGQPG